MTRPLALLAALVALLALWDVWLAGRERTARHEDRLGTLFAPEEAERLRRAPALRVELAGESHAYGRVSGRWLCLSHRSAPADAGALQAWIDALVRAEGLVQTARTEEAALYGINAPETVRVSLQGPRALQDPSGDVQVTLELGRTVAAGSGDGSTFVRLQGRREIWRVGGDLRAPIERRPIAGLPPLLEPGLVPRSWIDATGGPQRIELALEGESFALERRPRVLDPASARPGDLPWGWFLLRGEEVQELVSEVGAAFEAHLERLSYLDVLPSEQRDALGLARPRAVITLRGGTGEPLVLELGAPAGGRVPAWSPTSGTLYALAPEAAELATPTAERLLGADAEHDPWGPPPGPPGPLPPQAR